VRFCAGLAGGLGSSKLGVLDALCNIPDKPDTETDRLLDARETSKDSIDSQTSVENLEILLL
jgi:hypothetical protein